VVADLVEERLLDGGRQRVRVAIARLQRPPEERDLGRYRRA